MTTISNNIKINISNSTIIKLLVAAVVLMLLYSTHIILLHVGAIFFVAIIIAAAFHGPVSWLQQRHVPRLLGALFLYAVLFFIIALIVYIVFHYPNLRVLLSGESKQPLPQDKPTQNLSVVPSNQTRSCG